MNRFEWNLQEMVLMCRGALIIKRPTMLCNLILVLPREYLCLDPGFFLKDSNHCSVELWNCPSVMLLVFIWNKINLHKKIWWGDNCILTVTFCNSIKWCGGNALLFTCEHVDYMRLTSHLPMIILPIIIFFHYKTGSNKPEWETLSLELSLSC